MRDRLYRLSRRIVARARAAMPRATRIRKLIATIRGGNLSYCGAPKLENIADAALKVRAAGVAGCYLEAGVALGGSAILLGKLKPAGVRLDLYDVFGMIPPPGDNDGPDAHERYETISSGTSTGLGGEVYYGYVDNLLARVKDNLRRFDLDPEGADIRCIPGLFEDTLHPDGPVALAHIDCDWYDSVKVCIERIAPRLSIGGVIVFDDYSSYSGCQRAVDEWLSRDPGMEIIFHRRSLGLRRTALVPQGDSA